MLILPPMCFLGAAWFLAQHKATLGQKEIVSVTVWDNYIQPYQRPNYESAGRPCMVFRIQDKEAEGGVPVGDPGEGPSNQGTRDDTAELMVDDSQNER